MLAPWGKHPPRHLGMCAASSEGSLASCPRALPQVSVTLSAQGEDLTAGSCSHLPCTASPSPQHPCLSPRHPHHPLELWSPRPSFTERARVTVSARLCRGSQTHSVVSRQAGVRGELRASLERGAAPTPTGTQCTHSPRKTKKPGEGQSKGHAPPPLRPALADLAGLGLLTCK